METQRQALEITIRSSASTLTDRHAAHLALCRLLADQLDAGGAQASTRLCAAYLSALKDLVRVLAVLGPTAQHGRLASVRAIRRGDGSL